VMSAQALRLW